jgi:hypothetical protein
MIDYAVTPREADTNQWGLSLIPENDDFKK